MGEALTFSFEVRETDLLGRIGTIRVDGKTVETPCLLPVVHPVRQAVPVKDLEAMGFKALMTNSYITHSRRREEALNKGIHEMLGYGGIMMTDSGGYQVLEYGDLGLGYGDVAQFQAKIGSDIAVTLDRPTGHPQSRKTALDTMQYSLKNAVSTLEEFGGERTVWVGPVQGGLHLDLVRRSAVSMTKAGFKFLALGSPVQVMENYMFRDLVRMILAARRAMPYSLPLHLFGAGHPFTTALSVALGCDTFDSASYMLFARTGRYMSRRGISDIGKMTYLPCSCSVCNRTGPKELIQLEREERIKRLATHNLYCLREQLDETKEALAEGRLWDYVEETSMLHPRLADAFAEIARWSEVLVPGTQALKDRGMMVRTEADLRRPEVLMARERLGRAVSKSSTAAALLTGEGSAPLDGRRAPRRNARADAYRVNPVLGAYPAELDFLYPFSQTVHSQASKGGGEKEAKKALRKLGYDKVMSNSGRAGKARKVRSRRTRRGASPSPR